jgi:hypothetical protein
MSRYFTQYWKNSTWKEDFEKGYGHADYTAGNELENRKVKIGDFIYGITVIDGVLHVCCCIRVWKILGRKQAEKELGLTGLWPATKYFVSQNSVPLIDVEIPAATTKKLRFITSKGNSSAIFVKAGILDQQTFRGVRQLTPASAALLNAAFKNGPAKPDRELKLPEEITNPENFTEGASKKIYINAYERNSKARKACINHYGCKCDVCGFDFAENYGELGEGIITVHHVKKLADIKKEYKVDPITDLRPVCANCHAVIHRADPPLELDFLKRQLAKI